MRSLEDYVIAGVLPRQQPDGTSGSHLDYVLSKQVDGSYFRGPHHWLWKCALDAALLSEGKLDEVMVGALLDQFGVKGDDKQHTLLLYIDLAGEAVSRDKLRVILPSFMEGVHTDRFMQSLDTTSRILTEGHKIEREMLEGYKDARQFLMQQLADLDAHEVGTLPSENIREAATEFLEEYTAAKNTDVHGVLTGFKQIDELTRGIQKGELWIMCGYTGEGKSQFLLNAGYNACVRQGKNVVYISLEMPKVQVRRRIYVRHTNHPDVGVPGGLPYTRVKKGALNIDEEQLLIRCVTDFSTNPDYGKFQVVQVGKTETVPGLREKLTYLRSRQPIDLVVLDYASLVSGSRKRNNRQDEIIEVIEALKALALTFNEGEGLAILTANQISRQAKEQADKEGRYGIGFAAETSAIEKNADLLGWILRNEEMKAHHEAKVGISKYRDGDVLAEMTLMEHYASGLLADLDDDEAQIRF